MKRVSALWATLLAGLLIGCTGASEGPVPIALGTECSVCGMAIQNLRYACERETAYGLHIYDSIECLVQDSEGDGAAWLADYDTRSLHSADSMWVVKGDIPSPMGGGLAAFAPTRGLLVEVARRRLQLVRIAAPAVLEKTGGDMGQDVE